MFDWLYLWNLIWSFFLILSLVFVPAFMVLIYVITRESRAQETHAQTHKPARRSSGMGAAGTAGAFGVSSVPPLARSPIPPRTTPAAPPRGRSTVEDQAPKAA